MWVCFCPLKKRPLEKTCSTNNCFTVLSGLGYQSWNLLEKNLEQKPGHTDNSEKPPRELVESGIMMIESYARLKLVPQQKPVQSWLILSGIRGD